jgi:hypothetical protein
VAAGGIEALEGWHDFYVVLGTAAAAMIGAMFIVVSIGSGYLTVARAASARPFLTPTTIHLSTVLFGCALILVPTLDWRSFGLIYRRGSAAGLAYSPIIAVRVRRINVDTGDRIWYGLVPFIGYAVMAAAAGMAFRQEIGALDALAGAPSLILLAALRNAWDMVLYLVTRARDSH